MSVERENEKLKLAAYTWSGLGAIIGAGAILTPVVRMAFGEIPHVADSWSIGAVMLSGLLLAVFLNVQAQKTLDEWLE